MKRIKIIIGIGFIIILILSVSFVFVGFLKVNFLIVFKGNFIKLCFGKNYLGLNFDIVGIIENIFGMKKEDI